MGGVRNFDDKVWRSRLESIAYEVVLQKFGSSSELKKVLLDTGDAILAEAAPTDSIWGIGLPASDYRATDPDQWLGTNILGYALMQARKTLRGSRSSDAPKDLVNESQQRDREVSLPESFRKEGQESDQASTSPVAPSA